MRALTTGLNGTVAPVVADALRSAGADVVAWDRGADPPSSAEAVDDVIGRVAPDWVVHVATGPETWAGWIAQACASQRRRLLFTSSASVFRPRPPGGPRILPTDAPDATDEYGRYKQRAESLVLGAAPRALVPRLAWQIGPSPGTNTLDQHLDRMHAQHGAVEASRQWRPAVAWLSDTANALVELMVQNASGVVHLDGNPGLSMLDLARALRAYLGTDWSIEPVDSPAEDLLLGGARAFPSVTERLRG